MAKNVYSIIIVDDEYFPAKLLEKYITDCIDGFEVTEIFDDASEAIKYLASGGKADVVMTDIKMRKMSGVQLAKYIYTTKIKSEVIFVSAYADFEFAKEAMNYNVFGYLLKAVDINELRKMLGELRQKFDFERADRSEDDKLCRELFAENLLLGNFESESRLIRELDECFYSDNPDKFKCILLKITFDVDRGYDRLINYEGTEKTEAALVGIIKCVINKNDVSCISHENNIFYITVIDDEDSTEFGGLEDEIGGIFGVGVKSEIVVSKPIKDFVGETGERFEFLKKEKNTLIAHNGDRENIIQKAVEYIDENLENDMSRDSVSKAVGLTPVYFGRLFKDVVGTSFSDYIYEKRMKTAEKLLKAGMKTTDVCVKIGVIDERQFRRSFKLYSGMSPAEYRKAHKQTEESN